MARKIILNPTDAIFEVLGHLQQGELLLASVRAQELDTYEMADCHSLLQDAISQLRGELTNRTDEAAA